MDADREREGKYRQNDEIKREMIKKWNKRKRK
jgi:hypothetical protein